jgi:hypothetical protein
MRNADTKQRISILKPKRRRCMKKIFWTYIIVGLMSFLGLSSSVAALSLDFVPSSQTVVSGGLATVDLEVSGLTGISPYIGGFDVFVDFDPTLLGFVSFSYGQYLGDPTIFEALTQLSLINPGEVEIAEVSFLSPADLGTLQGGLTQFSLGTVAFDTVGTGTSDLNIALANVTGLVDQNGDPLYPSLVPGSITVTSPGPGPAPVPEPGTIFLVSVGLANVIAVVKRNKLRMN